MTDKEIIKALESEIHLAEYVDIDYSSNVNLEIIKSALDLITRQRAEIERFKIENQSLRGAANSYKIHYNEEIAEAVKEFVEKFEVAFFIKKDEEREQMLDILKSHRATLSYSDVEQATDNWLRGYGEAVQDVIGILDNLLKEMAGEN